MTTEGHPEDRGRDRAEEAFHAMTSEPPPAAGAGGPPPRGNPWKLATCLLLVLVLALPLAFALRTSGAEIDLERRMKDAKAELLAVRELVEDGQLGEAVVALHDAGMRVRPVEGAEAAAFDLKDAVDSRIAALEDEIAGTRAEILRRDRQAEVRARALGKLLAGKAGEAGKILAELEDDREAASLSLLAARMDAFDRAERRGESLRAEDLAELAGDWPLPGVRLAAERAAARDEMRKTVARELRKARSALSDGSAGDAKRALAGALAAGGVGPVEDIVAGILGRKRRERAAKLEAEGKAELAAALYRTVAAESDDPDAADRAGDLSRELQRIRLIGALASMAEQAAREEDFSAAAELTAALGRVGGGSGAERRAAIFRGRAFHALAAKYRESGDLRRALVFATEAVRLGDPTAEGVVDELEAIFARLDAESAVARAEAALADGAAAHARALLPEGAPRDLVRRIEALERREALSRVRAALDRGAGEEALALLDEARLADSLLGVPLAARARILAGEVNAGLELLPEDPETRVMALVAAALRLLPTAPAAAADRLARAREIAPGRADLTAALALAREAADPGADTKPLWESLRDIALERAPLPEPAEERGSPD